MLHLCPWDFQHTAEVQRSSLLDCFTFVNYPSLVDGALTVDRLSEEAPCENSVLFLLLVANMLCLPNSSCQKRIRDKWFDNATKTNDVRRNTKRLHECSMPPHSVATLISFQEPLWKVYFFIPLIHNGYMLTKRYICTKSRIPCSLFKRLTTNRF